MATLPVLSTRPQYLIEYKTSDAIVVDSRRGVLYSEMIGSISSSLLLVFYMIVRPGEVNAADLVPIKYEQMDSSYYPIHLWYAYGDPPASPFRFTISDKRSHADPTLSRKRSHFDPILFRKQSHFDPIMFRKSSHFSPHLFEEQSAAVNKVYKQ
ncbi:hypothetical protein EG68_00941 [Paragonimus skrjabini miyazakii]|uniref:Uncharacterized protein n=1 Tax=Paragonimus skrjabini miyazakii TaxID=59628 RepID=A0A8S9Z948_9TREM|nr:hypothetical protein EG68_00941 [Paragonimus skrjabini miyazakii]